MTKSKVIEMLNREYNANVQWRDKIPDDFDYLNDLLIALLTAIDALEQNSDVQPVKHGRWIWDSNAPHREYGAYKCSNCGCHSDFEENYCPNCGCEQDLDGDSK